jgi:hypothetical protein
MRSFFTAGQFAKAPRTSLIESLEPRAYFDLVPSIASPLPANIVATVKNTSTVTVDLTNTAGATIKGPYTLTLFASADTTLDIPGDTQIATISKSLPSLASGKFIPIKFKLSDFPDVPNGSYFLLADVTGTLAGAGDNIATSDTSIAVADPFIDLTDSISNIAPASGQADPGQPITVAVEIFNNGNIIASGPITTDVSASTSPDGSSPAHVITLKESIHLAPGTSKIFRSTGKIPLGYTPGTYYWVATADSNNSIGESTLANNTAISPTPLTVLDPYPNLLGTYSGPETVKKGPGKGAIVTVILDFVSEDSTGHLTANGTLVEINGTRAPFTFNGTISTKGIFFGKTSSHTTFYVATFKGKLVGQTLEGPVSNTDGNSGTFALTLEG